MTFCESDGINLRGEQRLIDCLHVPTVTFELTIVPEALRYELLTVWILVEVLVGVFGDGKVRAKFVILASKLAQTKILLRICS